MSRHVIKKRANKEKKRLQILGEKVAIIFSHPHNSYPYCM